MPDAGGRAPDPTEIARRERADRAQRKRRVRQAGQVWDEARAIFGTLADKYLHNRPIHGALPDTLRYHTAYWHGPSARRRPVMVARVDIASAVAKGATVLGGACDAGSVLYPALEDNREDTGEANAHKEEKELPFVKAINALMLLPGSERGGRLHASAEGAKYAKTTAGWAFTVLLVLNVQRYTTNCACGTSCVT